jgi:hypothetical protein
MDNLGKNDGCILERAAGELRPFDGGAFLICRR